VLTDFGTRDLLALIEAEQTRGRARVLAEPTLMAADRDSASFLSGGEIPIPIATPGPGGLVQIAIVFREFGVRLNFVPEILSDSLIKLRVRPEVSSLDFANALLLSGFRVPALRTRRVESTVDVRRDRSLVISGLFNDEREQVRSGIPLLMDIPILGNLFSSTRWQRNETELVIVVTPMVVDPLRPRAQDTIRLKPDTALPAREVIQPRLVPPAAPAPSAPPRRP
jgi:pilus assembly protein CpaC